MTFSDSLITDSYVSISQAMRPPWNRPNRVIRSLYDPLSVLIPSVNTFPSWLIFKAYFSTKRLHVWRFNCATDLLWLGIYNVGITKVPWAPFLKWIYLRKGWLQDLFKRYVFKHPFLLPKRADVELKSSKDSKTQSLVRKRIWNRDLWRYVSHLLCHTLKPKDGWN